MAPESSIILHATSLYGESRTYRCTTPLELSNALATEMLRAQDPGPITRWMKQDAFYHFWTSLLASGESRRSSPGACLYTDSSIDGLPTYLSVTGETK